MLIYEIWIYKGETSCDERLKAFSSKEKAEKWAKTNVANERYRIATFFVEV